MINSKRKGKNGELAFCKLCKEAGYDVHRTAQFKGNTGQAGDVEGLPGIHVEVKNTERLNLREAMAQSIHDAEAAGNGEIPIVAHKKNRADWLVTMRFDDFMVMMKRWCEHV